MIHLLHKDDTGSFQELARESEGIEFGQLSLLTVAPRCKRGGHYHTYKTEWFCCVHGSCYIVLSNLEGKQIGSLSLSDTGRKFVVVKPYEVHTILNPHDQECELLVICTEEYDPGNPDTMTSQFGGQP
jgi:UDP-2-acetamido-2,6-beta-L-arabino-hexul-4-ose reductase